ncbi:hypothetical protein GCM10010343_60890 [Streptomyces avidinii]|nr:hypothetical protein GCM10010343_60890 [Streptomyces avidinii]
MYDGQHTAGLPEGPGRVAPAQRLHPGPRHGGGQGAVDRPDLLRGIEDESYGDRGAEEIGGDCGRAVPTGLVSEAPCGRKGLPGRSGHSLRRKMNMPHGPPWHVVYDNGRCPWLPLAPNICRTGKQYDKHPYGKCRLGQRSLLLRKC